jgi:hypothetical protein
MAYTPSANKLRSTVENFGGLRVDGNRVALTGATGNYIQSQDATGTPVTSPATVNTTATLTVPQNAYALTIISTTNAVQISEDSTMSVYFTLPAATLYTINVANQQYVYLKTGSSTVVNFQFQTI